ncbi:TetR/AcrR family transcriptional regulator [Phycisphaerales bacterium AB-hyl4]|uniref:TetR/AcrR family transcriptional regulator n=1 Tax=Natronomicrosphaera hydrolytica TaxID=3242702 RepID=A0ABV4U6D1_9BACT
MPRFPRKPGRPRDEALVARRRDEILDVAVAVFAEHGYRLTDVQVIADRLSLGKGTVYRYFPTKEALFLAAVDRGMRRLQSAIDEQVEAEADPVEQMRRAVEAYLAYFDTQPELVELLMQERAEFKDRKQSTYFFYVDQCRADRRERIKALQAEGLMRKLPPDRIIDVMDNVMYGAIFTNHFAGRRKSFQQQADEILDVVMYGCFEPGDRETLKANSRTETRKRPGGSRAGKRKAGQTRRKASS